MRVGQLVAVLEEERHSVGLCEGLSVVLLLRDSVALPVPEAQKLELELGEVLVSGVGDVRGEGVLDVLAVVEGVVLSL